MKLFKKFFECKELVLDGKIMNFVFGSTCRSESIRSEMVNGDKPPLTESSWAANVNVMP